MRILYMTCPESDAVKLTSRLLDENVIACANVFPGVTSVYRWQGKVETGPEAAVIMKTADAVAPRALARIKELHPYDVPAISIIAPEGVDADYAAWVDAETRT
jgi:periplasmic divalent cation tolerance protein